MDKFNFDSQRNTLQANYKFFKKFSTLMLMANIILVIGLIMSMNREKIVLIPQVAPEYKMWIKKSQISPEYINTLSRNVLDLLLNVTTKNVNAQYQELMRIVAPKSRSELQAKLTEIAKQITQNNLSQNFYIENIRIVNGTNTVYVRGSLNQFIDNNNSNTKQQTYKLTFTVHNYMVELTNLELIPENDPQLRDLKNE